MSAHPRSRVELRAAALAAFLVAPLALTACVSTDRSQSGGEAVSDCPWEGDDSVEGTVEIGWQRIPNGDLIVQDRKLLETCMPNVTVNWTAYDSGADVVKAYTKGLDLALIGNSPSTTAMSPPNGLDVDVVWVHDVIGQAESLIAKDAKVKSIEDLRGETIGVPYGSTAHYSLVQALSAADLDATTDVKLINLQPDAMPAAWKSGDVAAVWVWDPTQSQLLETGGHRILSSADTAEEGYPTFDLGTASAAFVEENPGFMAQWAAAQDYAVRLILDKPDEAAEIVGAVLALPKDDVLKQFEGYTYLDAATQVGADYLGGKLGEDLTSTAGFLVDQAGIESALTPEEYAEHVDAAPAESVAGESR